MRLIDADALDMAFTNLRFNQDMSLAHWGDRKDWCLHGHEVEKLIYDAPTVDRWISVKERLPNKGQIVIASDGEHTWDVGMYKSFCGKPSEWNWKKNTIKTVLWWMPKDGALPEPPKENE